MNWKTKTLEELRQNASVEAVPASEDQFLVTVKKSDGSELRTLVRLDGATKTIHYANGHPHTLDTIAQLIASMKEHLKAV